MNDIKKTLLSEDVIDECLEECLEPIGREYKYEMLQNDDIRK